MSEEFSDIIEAMKEMASDSTVPQSVRVKLNKIVQSFNDKTQDKAILANKVLDELEAISNDTNIPSYTRTQIWNLSSMLELIH
ncbi:MAG TPA: UPF0147 family protein [Acidobacteriota bacterium]|nr:UPF0147 family protein [Acidobacteriota bacterium]